jgi:hypothetical protein
VERYRAFLHGEVGTGLVLWLPVLIPGPGAVLDQVLRFQLTRPGDGTVGATERLGFILAAPSSLIHSRHIAATLLGCAGLIVVVVWRRRDRLAGIAAVWCIPTVVAFSVAAACPD